MPWRNKRNKKPRDFYGIPASEILPENIRYANAHNGARLGRKDIESLFEKGREDMRRLGLYSAMKAVADDHLIQINILRRVVALDYNLEALTKDDVAEAMEHLESKKNPTIQSGKLAQVSRYGFRTFPDRFDQVLGKHGFILGTN